MPDPDALAAAADLERKKARENPPTGHRELLRHGLAWPVDTPAERVPDWAVDNVETAITMIVRAELKSHLGAALDDDDLGTTAADDWIKAENEKGRPPTDQEQKQIRAFARSIAVAVPGYILRRLQTKEGRDD